MVRAGAWMLGVFAVLAGVAAGQNTNSTSPDGTPAAGAKVDLSSPKSALTSLYTAMRNGDVMAAKSCMHFADARQAELFELNFVQMWGPLRLMRAMEAKFGEAGKKPFANAALEKPVDHVLDRLKTIEFEVQGNQARLSEKKAEVNPSAENELTGIVLIKEGEQWKVMAGTLSDLASDMPADQVQTMRILAHAVEVACAQTITQLERGQFATPQQAYADYQARVQAATHAAAEASAATRPRG